MNKKIETALPNKTTFLACMVIVFGLLSCNTMSERNQELKIATEPLDTIKSFPATIEANPRLFETAFIPGTIEKGKTADVNFYGVTIGNLKIKSGKLIACDPGHIDEYGIPFTQVFPNGEFPVQLSIAKVGGEETIAFARVNFNNEPVVRWEFALQNDQTQLPIEGEEMRGYSTDLSAGIFMDAESSKVLDKSNLTDSDADLYKQMDQNYRNEWKYAMYNFGTHNLAAFTSGLGDGFYGTYIGFDAKGNPCRLLTDFGLVNWRKK